MKTQNILIRIGNGTENKPKQLIISNLELPLQIIIDATRRISGVIKKYSFSEIFVHLD